MGVDNPILEQLKVGKAKPSRDFDRNNNGKPGMATSDAGSDTPGQLKDCTGNTVPRCTKSGTDRKLSKPL